MQASSRTVCPIITLCKIANTIGIPYYSPLNNQTELRKNFCNYGDGKNSTGN